MTPIALARSRRATAVAILLPVAALPRSVRAQWRSTIDVGSGVTAPALSGRPALVGGTIDYAGLDALLRITSRSEPMMDEQRWTETRFTAAFRRGAGGLGAMVSGASSTSGAPGLATARRTDLRAGPSWKHGDTQVAAFAGISRLSGARAADRVSTAGALLDRALAFGSFRVTTQQVAFDTFAERDVDSVFIVAGFPFHSHSRRQTLVRERYASVQADLDWRLGRSEWTFTGGARAGEQLGSRTWEGMSAMLPLTSRVALVTELGRRGSIPEQHLPATRFASVAVRLFNPVARARPEAAPGVGAARLDVARDSAGALIIEVVGVDAHRIELMGDFNDWTPASLRSDGERRWRLSARVTAGVHRVLMRVNGGAWRVPPGVSTETSEFGEQVGLLLVTR